MPPRVLASGPKPCGGKNERITKTNGRSMKHRNADNGIISTFVKLSFLSLSVMRQI